MMNHNTLFHILLAFFWMTLFLPFSSNAQDKLRVGLSSISATSGSIWVAEEIGLFKKHGIDAEVIVIGGGASRVVSSLIAGEIQFSVGGGDSVIRSSLRGADTVVNGLSPQDGSAEADGPARHQDPCRAERKEGCHHPFWFRLPLGLTAIS